MVSSNELGLITFIKYVVASVRLIPSEKQVNIVLPNLDYHVGEICGLAKINGEFEFV